MFSFKRRAASNGPASQADTCEGVSNMGASRPPSRTEVPCHWEITEPSDAGNAASRASSWNGSGAPLRTS